METAALVVELELTELNGFTVAVVVGPVVQLLTVLTTVPMFTTLQAVVLHS